jgi:hypothetical protein
MLKTTTADAMMLLTHALHTLPTEPDPRSEFFIQWRTRTIESVERIYADDPAISQGFKEIEFSPRRLTRDAEKDEQLKLDACLAGYAQARLMLERLISAVTQQSQVLAEPPKPSTVVISGPPAEVKTAPYAALCSSILQAVKPGEIDDSGSMLTSSAQLLRNLSTGLADPALRVATERMMSQLSGGTQAAKKGPDWEQADVFVWSILMALSELKRSA